MNYDDEQLLADDPELLHEAEKLKERPSDQAEVGAVLLQDIIDFIRMYVFLSTAQATVLALWVLHCHLFQVFDFTPYALVTSPEKRCGKSRLLEVLELLVPRPWGTNHPSPPVLYRKIHRVRPILFFDEVDRALQGPKEYVQAICAVINEGDRRNGHPVSLCVKKGNNWVDADFSAYCPKVLSGIGQTLETWADRGFQIRLERKPKGSDVRRFRYREAAAEGKALSERARHWCAGQRKALAAARPEMPDELNDRQIDHCESLIAIADALAGGWPEKARLALVGMCLSVDAEDQSPSVRLVADIAVIFAETNADKLFSATIIEGLVADEGSPWPEYSRGKPITQAALARLLKKFKDHSGTRPIQPRMVDIAGTKLRGYRRKDFLEVWRRYTPNVPASLLKAAEKEAAEEDQPDEGATQESEQPQADLFHPNDTTVAAGSISQIVTATKPQPLSPNKDGDGCGVAVETEAMTEGKNVEGEL